MKKPVALLGGVFFALALALTLWFALGQHLMPGRAASPGSGASGLSSVDAEGAGALMLGSAEPPPLEHSPQAAQDMETRAGRAAVLSGAGTGLRVELVYDVQPVTFFGIEVERQADGQKVGTGQRTYGHGRWEGVMPGAYRVHASAEGWVPAVEEVEVAPGDLDVEIRIPMMPFNSFAGVVIDGQEGSPLSRFHVEVEMLSEQSGGFIWTARQLEFQCEAGRFGVGGAPAEMAEQVRVIVSADGYATATTDWFPAQEHIEGVVVVLHPEEQVTSIVSLRTLLTEGPPAVGTQVLVVDARATMDSFQLHGRAPVLYSSADVTGEVALGGARGVTDSSGRARVGTQYEGAARLLVIPSEGRAFFTEPFELARGRTLDLGDFYIEAGSLLYGRVWIGEVPENKSVDAVEAVSQTGAHFMANLEADGSFRIPGLDPGVYRVSVVCGLLTPNGSRVGSIPISTVRVPLGHSEERFVELHCWSEGVGSTVAGRVETVEDLSEIRVVLLDLDLAPVGMSFADENGDFRLTDIPAGQFTLAVVGRSAEMDRFAATWRPLRLPDPELPSQFVSLRHSRVDIHAPGAGRDPLRVSSRTESELFDQLVGQALQGRLGEDGRSILWGLPAGTYRVSTPRGERDVVISEAGGTHRLDF